MSAYKDNVAFIKGPTIEQFAPQDADRASAYQKKQIPSIISIKAETHNFPLRSNPLVVRLRVRAERSEIVWQAVQDRSFGGNCCLYDILSAHQI